MCVVYVEIIYIRTEWMTTALNLGLGNLEDSLGSTATDTERWPRYHALPQSTPRGRYTRTS